MLRSTSARAFARARHRNRPSATRVRALVLQTCPGIGETGQAERLVAEMTREERGTGPVRPVVVLLPLAAARRMGGSLARAVVARDASAVLGGSPGDDGAKLAAWLGDAANYADRGRPGGIASRSWEGDRRWTT